MTLVNKANFALLEPECIYSGAVMIYGYGYVLLTYDFMVPFVISYLPCGIKEPTLCLPCDIIIYLAVPCATLRYLVQNLAVLAVISKTPSARRPHE